MIESAYKKSLNYTTGKLFDIIEHNLQWDGQDNPHKG